MKIKPNASNEFDVEGAKKLLAEIAKFSQGNFTLDMEFHRALGYRTREQAGVYGYYDQQCLSWISVGSPTTNVSDIMEWLPEHNFVSMYRVLSQPRSPDSMGERKWKVYLYPSPIDIHRLTAGSKEHQSLPLAWTEAILLFYIAVAEEEKVDIPAAVS